MKTKLSLVLVGLFLLSQSVWATTTTFTVSATVPSASGISVAVSQVNATSNAFTAEPSGTTALSFDPMTFNTTTLVYVPSVYYAIDFGVAGGSGRPDVTFTYNEGTNPNGPSNGFGTKSSITYAQETSTGEVILAAHPKTTLASVSGTHVAFTELSSGAFLRAYIGVCTGGASDPSGCHPFTNSDASGTYSGSLVTTAVVN